MIGPLTYLDVALLGLCLISGLLAMARGLTRELLSIVSWLLAAAATLWVVRNQKDLAEQLADQFFQSTTLSLIVLGAVTFMLVLLIVHIITIRFSDTILESGIGLIDRVLGFVFGVARGFLLVVIAYLFFEFLVEENKQPVWVSKSQSLPYIKSTGHTVRAMLQGILPEDFSIPGIGDGNNAGDQQG
ncbi:MAG: CvpA family protein [Rhizobiales bacterium]|nr:CvpA family protein [Hyphomicrobiales bacterium]